MNKKRSLKELLNVIKEPELNETFWENFKSETLRKTRHERQKSIDERFSPAFFRKPVLAIAVVIVLISSTVFVLYRSGKNEPLYTETIDFYIDEFDSIISQNVLISENEILVEEKEQR